jgi:hypothetical protein
MVESGFPPHLHVLIIVRIDVVPLFRGSMILVAIKQPAQPAERRGLF